MPYSFPIPRGRGYIVKDEEKKCRDAGPELWARDVILHILHARVAASDGQTHEFDTIYDRDHNYIELDIPDCYLDFLETIEVGPRIQRYLRWLLGIVGGAVAENLVWNVMEELTEVVPGNTYRTPYSFFEDSLVVFLNGVRLERTNEDGYDILDNQTFKLRETYPVPRHRISVGYMKTDIP